MRKYRFFCSISLLDRVIESIVEVAHFGSAEGFLMVFGLRVGSDRVITQINTAEVALVTGGTLSQSDLRFVILGLVAPVTVQTLLVGEAVSAVENLIHGLVADVPAAHDLLSDFWNDAKVLGLGRNHIAKFSGNMVARAV